MEVIFKSLYVAYGRQNNGPNNAHIQIPGTVDMHVTCQGEIILADGMEVVSQVEDYPRPLKVEEGSSRREGDRSIRRT